MFDFKKGLERMKNIVEFIQSLYPDESPVGLHQPRFLGNEKKYLQECIDSTYVSSVGPFVDRLELEMAEFTGAKKAVACVNGTNGLHLALLMVGVQPGDEVITQPLTFIATCNAISYCGAHPVFIDVDRDTLGLSPSKTEEWIQEHAELRADGLFNKVTGRRIRACVAMHTFGHPLRIEKLAALCRHYALELIEDAAESIGSFYKGKHTGTFGKIGVFSFNGNKTITTGGGGMLIFQDEELAGRAKFLSTQAKIPHRWEFIHSEVGYNYRMPNINAALGCAQMENLPYFLKKKRELADTYRDFFEKEGIPFVTEPQDSTSNYWLNAILLPDQARRDQFLEETNNQGVMTRPVWRLMYKLPMFAACQCGTMENAEFLAQRIVNLPSSVQL